MKLEKVVAYVITKGFRIRLKPETIQLPITGKCNSRCTTCNVWKQDNKCDIDVSALKKVLKDEYLQQVRYIGINGGEPFLHNHFIDVIKAILEVKKLKAIYIITNGIATERVLSNLKEVKKLCKEKGVRINLTVSLDGINDVYEDVRGVPGVFDRVEKTIHTIKSDLEQYGDSLTLGTTISKRNVEYLSQIKSYAHEYGIQVNYHLAVPNRRIYTANNEEYSVLNNERNKMLATEFFFGEYKYSNSWKRKLLYYQNYKFLIEGGMKRCSSCNYQKQDLTLDEHLNVYFCAKESKLIGNANDACIRELVKSKVAKEEEKRISRCCNTCGHYITLPSVKGFLGFCVEMFKPGVWVLYRILCAVKV